jgi:hypothetical protein
MSQRLFDEGLAHAPCFHTVVNVTGGMAAYCAMEG